MRRHRRPLGSAAVCLLVAGFGAVSAAQAPPRPPSDLDRFMERVLESREGDWKALQQYILDEREHIEILGPGQRRLWGEERAFMWFLRDGYFVRSPLRINGVTIGADERESYEREYLRRVIERDRRAAAREAAGTEADAVVELSSVDGLITQSREPQFASSSDFLRFTFDPGRYALVGRESFDDVLDGAELLRIEYYPTRLFEPDPDRDEPPRDGRGRGRGGNRSPERTEAVRTLLNKVSRVTLWVEPARHQIVRYIFENVSEDFIPASWWIRVGEVRAELAMVEAFPDVWLPGSLGIDVSMELAIGEFDMRYDLAYENYREADVTTTIRPVEDR